MANVYFSYSYSLNMHDSTSICDFISHSSYFVIIPEDIHADDNNCASLTPHHSNNARIIHSQEFCGFHSHENCLLVPWKYLWHFASSVLRGIKAMHLHYSMYIHIVVTRKLDKCVWRFEHVNVEVICMATKLLLQHTNTQTYKDKMTKEAK